MLNFKKSLNDWKKVADEEFEKANKAGLKDIINELKSAGKKDAGAAAEDVKMPPKEVVTSQKMCIRDSMRRLSDLQA